MLLAQRLFVGETRQSPIYTLVLKPLAGLKQTHYLY